MPISEDEYDSHTTSEATSSTMSKAELRKTHKPIMEKRRRARINHSLNEIKSLILNALNKDPARHSKLEKADILEMAVKHLQNVQKQQLARAIAMDPVVLQKFKAGFNECTEEVNTYITQIDGVEDDMKHRIKHHLQGCITGIEQMAQFNSITGLLNPSSFGFPTGRLPETGLGDQNNNPRIQIPQGIPLIPSRLPSGEVAFLLPNSTNLPLHFPTLANPNPQQPQNEAPQRPSAFVTVVPSSLAAQSQATSESMSKTTRMLSPPLSPEHPQQNENEVFANPARSTSPHGFRPVNPAIQKSLRSAFMSTALNKPELLNPRTEFSTALSNLANRNQTSNQERVQSNQPIILQDNRNPSDVQDSSEVKTMKFPIHTYIEKDRKFMASPVKKMVEPLCIITNQTERYKQAQTVEESANFEENLQPHGIKRKLSEFISTHGLLTVVQDTRNKIIKSSRECYPSSSKSSESAFSSVVPSGRIIVRNPLSMQQENSLKGQCFVDLTSESEPEENAKRNFGSNFPIAQEPVAEQPDSNNDMWRPW